MIGVDVVGQGGGTATAISGSLAVIGGRDCDGRGDDIVSG